MNKKKYRLGFIGCGHMGMSIAKGAVAKEYLERYQIAVYDPSKSVQDACQIEGFTCLENETVVCENCSIVLLAVRPQDLEETLAHIQGADITCLLSIVTSASISYLQSKLNDVPIIRAMPNTPLQIGQGATALCRSQNCKADDYDFVYKLFSTMGITRSIPESQMENIIVVHGSTPAYVYYFIDCLVQDAVSRGVEEEAARDLLVQTFIGSALLLQKQPHRSLEDFINEVCSKGGTTIEAIQEMKDQHLAELLHECNEKCINRAKEMGK